MWSGEDLKRWHLCDEIRKPLCRWAVFAAPEPRSLFHPGTSGDVCHHSPMAPMCKTCTHVSYQQISILTLNFNTSFVAYLTIVATLEYFTLAVFFSVFVERCSRVWLGCIERYTWFAVFDENTRFFSWSRYVFLLYPAETLVSLVSLLSGRQRWKSAEHVALSISVSFSLFSLLVSVSVFGTIQRELACPCAVSIPINREV